MGTLRHEVTVLRCRLLAKVISHVSTIRAHRRLLKWLAVKNYLDQFRAKFALKHALTHVANLVTTVCGPVMLLRFFLPPLPFVSSILGIIPPIYTRVSPSSELLHPTTHTVFLSSIQVLPQVEPADGSASSLLTDASVPIHLPYHSILTRKYFELMNQSGASCQTKITHKSMEQGPVLTETDVKSTLTASNDVNVDTLSDSALGGPMVQEGGKSGGRFITGGEMETLGQPVDHLSNSYANQLVVGPTDGEAGASKGSQPPDREASVEMKGATKEQHNLGEIVATEVSSNQTTTMTSELGDDNGEGKVLKSVDVTTYPQRWTEAEIRARRKALEQRVRNEIEKENETVIQGSGLHGVSDMVDQLVGLVRYLLPSLSFLYGRKQSSSVIHTRTEYPLPSLLILSFLSSYLRFPDWLAPLNFS